MNNWKHLLINLILYLIAIISTILLWDKPTMLTLFLIVVWFIVIGIWDSKKEILAFILATALGTVAEIFIINFGGTWAYNKPQFLNIPLWLPFLWGYTGIVLFRIIEMVYLWRNKHEEK